MTDISQTYFTNYSFVGKTDTPVIFFYHYRERDSLEREFRELDIYATDLERQLQEIYEAMQGEEKN